MRRLGEGVGRWLKRLLSSDPAPQSPPAPPPPPPPPQEPGLSPEVVRLLADRDVVAAGRIRFIGLEQVRERLGPRWARIGQVVHAVAERSLTAHLGPGDAWSRLNDVAYLVVFAEPNTEEALRVCAQVAAEIEARLFGETPERAIRVATAVNTVDGRLVLRADDPWAFLDAAMESAEARSAALAASLDRVEVTFEEATPAASEQWHEVYMPVWAVDRGAVSVQLCQPVLTLPGGQELFGYAGLRGNSEADALARLDTATLRRVCADLAAPPTGAERTLLATTVHCRTLERADRRQAFLEVLMPVHELARKRLLVEVVGLDDTSSETRIAGAIGTVYHHCLRVAVRLPLGSRRLDRLRAFHILVEA